MLKGRDLEVENQAPEFWLFRIGGGEGNLILVSVEVWSTQAAPPYIVWFRFLINAGYQGACFCGWLNTGVLFVQLGSLAGQRLIPLLPIRTKRP